MSTRISAGVDDHRGLLGLTRYSDPASRKHHSNVCALFVKALKFRGEINKLRYYAYNFTRLIS